MKADYDQIARQWIAMRTALPEKDAKLFRLFTDEMFGVVFSYDSLTPSAMRELCQHSGFRVLQQVQVNEPDGGRDKGRVAFLLRKD
jgi:hypothetical protein